MPEEPNYLVDTWSGSPRYLCLICGTSTVGQHEAFARLTIHLETVHGVEPVQAEGEPGTPPVPDEPDTPDEPEGDPVPAPPAPDKEPVEATVSAEA